MNRRLSEIQIRGTCRELAARGKKLSGRRLRRELADRFGSVGNTERVFQIWREETREPSPVVELPQLPTEVTELQRRLRAAESAAADSLARAERAEYREQAHQDHWAMEIDRLRREAQARPDYVAQIRSLNEQIRTLTAQLMAARAGSASS
jgi:Plasmid replication region DNA-binding N-term